ncbi:MAG: acyltransferase [Oscillochloridaceae bacterium]|nr:N-acetyltransferase [Chloroflexaceae bacterium]MDW8390722.1 acyltransferase [Oscillochloridaceae bacterium]
MSDQESRPQVSIHPTAIVDPQARIGPGTRIWHWTQVREGVVIGSECIIGRGCYIDIGVQIGRCVKFQSNISVFHGVTIEDGVFVGPHVCFTNDKVPRAINPDGTLKAATDWKLVPTLIRYGASLGANATIVCGVTVGRFAMVGSGAVVTRDVPDYGLVVGNPARLIGYVCACGQRLPGGPLPAGDPPEQRVCPACGRETWVGTAPANQGLSQKE